MKRGISASIIAILGFGLLVQQSWLLSGCAQISAPTGGPKDSLAPRLLGASPAVKSVNVSGNKITLYFDEYVEVKDAFNKVLVSPLPKNTPSVEHRLKTVTVRLKDTLLPNTTYSIDFGNAIMDINEGNPLSDFTYVFSTGRQIDSLKLGGKVLLAENGRADSTLMAMLYRDAPDSAVEKRRPDYMARLNGEGRFSFTNLPPGRFKLYALKDGDGSKSYNAKTETFAFADADIIVADSTPAVTLYAYSEQKDSRSEKTQDAAGTTPPPANDKKLRYTNSLVNGQQDLLGNLVLSFNRKLAKTEEGFIALTDTSYGPVAGAKVTADSTRKNFTVTAPWQPGGAYCLIINNKLGQDSTGLQLAKADTVRFLAKREEDYGKLVLRFSKIDSGQHLVLQFVQAGNVVKSQPITVKEWTDNRFRPGEYDLRILFDTNNNGQWDPGNYGKKQQPERVLPLQQKLSIRANWDNERDIKL
jgi:uncharacterized protein (DUF2141 family)